MGTTMKRSDDFISVPYREATLAILTARSKGISLSLLHGNNINMSKSDNRIDEAGVIEVRGLVKDNKSDILQIFLDQETYQTPLAQMRGQLIEFNMQISDLLKELWSGIIAYNWLFPEEECFTGIDGGCNDPPIHPKCNACRKESGNDDEEIKAI